MSEAKTLSEIARDVAQLVNTSLDINKRFRFRDVVILCDYLALYKNPNNTVSCLQLDNHNYMISLDSYERRYVLLSTRQEIEEINRITEIDMREKYISCYGRNDKRTVMPP